jgi:alkylation response protein AidB-like acyl-CoA dehydrogenase
VRPIITIDGSHEVNDVFLEDVRVPVENLIGEENKGWTYAKFLLGNERTSMAGIGRSTRYLNRLKQIVKTEIAEDDPSFGEFIKAIQLHGGMGMSDELNVGHYFKRIAAINVQFGDPTYHLMRYAQQDESSVASDVVLKAASSQR